MASPYQSKLLRLLLSQSRRWQNQAAEAWNRARLSLYWGTEMILRSVAWWFQPARVAISSRGVDHALERVLERISIVPDQGVVIKARPWWRSLTWSNKLSPGARVQGIASLVADHRLVIVDTQGQILDLLTADQQTQLRRYLEGESADHRLRIPPLNLPWGRQAWTSLNLALEQGKLLILKPQPVDRATTAILAQIKLLELQTVVVTPGWAIRAGRVAGLVAWWGRLTGQAPPKWASAPLQVAGIACLLTDRRLVLIDPHNQILDLLTPTQQVWLSQRLAKELASREGRFPSVGWGWLTGGPRLVLPPQDTPLVRTLASISLSGPQTAVLAAPPHPWPWWQWGFLAGLGAIKPRQITPPAPTRQVHGIASLVLDRRLVLIDDQNQILDILTPAQQAQLWRRLVWEIADYSLRYRRFSQGKILRLGPAALRVLAPARRVYGLLAGGVDSPRLASFSPPLTPLPSPPASPWVVMGAVTPACTAVAESPWIEVSAIPLGYVPHPLARLLTWIDRILATLEAWLERLQAWFRRA